MTDIIATSPITKKELIKMLNENFEDDDVLHTGLWIRKK